MDLFGDILIGSGDLDSNIKIAFGDFDFFDESERDNIAAKAWVFNLFEKFDDLIFLKCHGGKVRPILKFKRKNNDFYWNRFDFRLVKADIPV